MQQMISKAHRCPQSSRNILNYRQEVCASYPRTLLLCYRLCLKSGVLGCSLISARGFVAVCIGLVAVWYCGYSGGRHLQSFLFMMVCIGWSSGPYARCRITKVGKIYVVLDCQLDERYGKMLVVVVSDDKNLVLPCAPVLTTSMKKWASAYAS